MAIKSPKDGTTNGNSLASFYPPTTAFGYSEDVLEWVNRFNDKRIVEYINGYQARLESWLTTAQERSATVINTIYPDGDGTVEKLNEKLKEISKDWDNLTGQGMIVEFLVGTSKESVKDYKEAQRRMSDNLTAAYKAAEKDGTIAHIFMERFKIVFSKYFEDEENRAALYVMGLIQLFKFLQDEAAKQKTKAEVMKDADKMSFSIRTTFRSTVRLKESKKFRIDPKTNEIYVAPEMFTPEQRKVLNKKIGNVIRQNLVAQGKTLTNRRPYTLGSARDDQIDLDMTEGTAHIVSSIESQGKNLFFNWSAAIDYHTHSSFREALGLKKNDQVPSYDILCSKNPLGYKTKIAKMIDKICSVVGNPALMRKIIEEEVLPKDPLVFFVGRETKKMSGVLGEIAGMYMIRSLNPTIPLTFSANLTDKMGKQFHADILVQDTFGIQAKNTKDLYQSTIGFRDASASTILADPLFGDMGQIIGNLQALRYFNIPYNKDENGTYFEVDDVNQVYRGNPPNDIASRAADKYISAYNVLTKIVPQLDRFLQMSAAAMMYLQVGENLSNNATDLFILGTRTAVTTAQIIQTLIQDFVNDPKFGEGHHFHIKTSLADPELKGYDYGNTIVDYFNEGQSYRTKKAGRANTKIKSLSQYLERITLTSSFNFSDLIPQSEK